MGRYKEEAYLQTFQKIKIYVDAQTGTFRGINVPSSTAKTLAECQEKITEHVRKTSPLKSIVAMSYDYGWKISGHEYKLIEKTGWDGTTYDAINENNEKVRVYLCNPASPRHAHEQTELLKETDANAALAEQIDSVNKSLEKLKEEYEFNVATLQNERFRIFGQMERWTVAEIEVEKEGDA